MFSKNIRQHGQVQIERLSQRKQRMPVIRTFAAQVPREYGMGRLALLRFRGYYKCKIYSQKYQAARSGANRTVILKEPANASYADLRSASIEKIQEGTISIAEIQKVLQV